MQTRSARLVLTSASAAQVAVSFVTFGLPAIGPQLRDEFGLGLPGRGAVLDLGARRWNALVYVSAGERAQPELSGGSVAVAGTVVFGLSALAPSTRLGRLERV